jgi:hypothetical protein
MTPAWPGYDTTTAPTGNPPAISSFSASSTTISAGAQVTLNWSATNDSYDFIDKIGGVHGTSATVSPSATTTYTLNTTDQYGRSTAKMTITVR